MSKEKPVQLGLCCMNVEMLSMKMKSALRHQIRLIKN